MAIPEETIEEFREVSQTKVRRTTDARLEDFSLKATIEADPNRPKKCIVTDDDTIVTRGVGEDACREAVEEFEDRVAEPQQVGFGEIG